MNKLLLFTFTTLIFLSCQTNQDNQTNQDKIRTIELTKEVKSLRHKNKLLERWLEQEKSTNKELKHKLKYSQSKLAKNRIEEIYSVNKVATTGIKILRIGTFHGNEIENNVEDIDWLGLIKKGENYSLKKMKINVDSCYDVIVDKKGETTGKQVTTEKLEEPIILIHGLKNIQEGEILSVEFKKSFLYPGERMSIKYNGDWISLSAYGTANPDEIIRDYMLQVSSKNIEKQVLAVSDGFDDTTFKFQWAGDIDGDGILDLIMDLSDHYNKSRLTLFLSSMAEDGELFKRVAEFKNVGC